MTEEVAPMHEEVAPTHPPVEEFVVEEPHREEVVVEVPVEEPKVEEVIVEPTPVVVVEPPVAKSKNPEKPGKSGSKEKVVRTSALVFKSNSRNSVSVGLVQERLLELGFTEAGTDKYGWLCEGTMESLAKFAKTTVEKCNPQDASMISALFAGTQVKVAE
jgi:hypothetical protein